MRDHNAEYADQENRLYAYDFDYLMHKYFLNDFRPFFNCYNRALELGCYKGHFTQLIAKEFASVTVVEGADSLISEAKLQAGDNVTFIHSQFENVELEDKFDVIFLNHTLEHLAQPSLTLNKIKGWLKEDGVACIAVPNANAASRQIAVNMGLIDTNVSVTDAEYKHGHRMTYTLDSLRHELISSGLKVSYMGGVFFKAFANFQLDQMLEANIIDQSYLDGCYALGKRYPDMCSSIFAICRA